MTAQELAEIRKRAETALNMGSIAWESADGVQVLWTIFKEDIPKLLAEVERLQARVTYFEGNVEGWLAAAQYV